MKMQIVIKLTDKDGKVENHPIDVEAELPETGDNLIDNVEKAILKLNKVAIRLAIESYLEELSKKNPNCARNSWRNYPE